MHGELLPGHESRSRNVPPDEAAGGVVVGCAARDAANDRGTLAEWSSADGSTTRSFLFLTLVFGAAY
jgi:hypothetical protein